jgi:hypothetical protein
MKNLKLTLKYCENSCWMYSDGIYGFVQIFANCTLFVRDGLLRILCGVLVEMDGYLRRMQVANWINCACVMSFLKGFV